MGRRVILYELNEVPLRVFDEFASRQPGALIARRHGDFSVYETFCEDAGPLSPWVTWPTLERGVTDVEHGIRHFGQALDEIDHAFPPVWKLLASAGISTGVFGSLHTYPLPPDSDGYAFYVPDTFAAGSECHPPTLAAFQDFNLSMARESARNVSTRVPWKPALRFLLNAPRLGLRLTTVFDLVQQLVAERRMPWLRVRRRTYQTVVGFDLFLKQLTGAKPAFSTFFTNHVASAMHRYWAASFPGDFEKSEYPQEWVQRYSGEIDFAMEKADAEIERLVRFTEANPDYVLLVASSMGQAATTARVVRTQTYLRDIARFMSYLGIADSDWEKRPAMDPDVNVFLKAERIERFRDAVGRLEINGEPIRLDERESGFFNLGVAGVNAEDLPPFASDDGKQVHFKELGLENLEIEDQAGTSAYHVPEGSLMVFDPKRERPRVMRERVSTLEIAPFLLRNFGVSVPGYMRPAGDFAPF